MDGGTDDFHGLGPKAACDRRLVTSETPEIFLAHLGYSSVVAGPFEYATSECGHLPSPLLIVLVNVAGSNQKDVDIAIQTSVTSRRRSKDRGMKGQGAPRLEVLTKSVKETPTQICQIGDGLSGKVVPIQRVDACAARLPPMDKPVFD